MMRETVGKGNRMFSPDQLGDLGILGDLPESNQISLFDLVKVSQN